MQIFRAPLLCLLAAVGFGQGVQKEPSFEVAEIRVNISGANDSRGDIENGRLTIRNVPLRNLIAEAWMITKDDVAGPAWLDDVRVDILAKAPATTPDQDVRRMLQTLLKERMKLVAHTDQREKPVWALTVWKGIPKLTPNEMPVKAEDADCTFTAGASGVRYSCRRFTMSQLARKLPEVGGRYVDKRVVDQTGLIGAWEFSIEWTPPARLESDGGLSLFAALQAQLGLQLENKKLPVAVVVVDSMEKMPTDN